MLWLSNGGLAEVGFFMGLAGCRFLLGLAGCRFSLCMHKPEYWFLVSGARSCGAIKIIFRTQS